MKHTSVQLVLCFLTLLITQYVSVDGTEESTKAKPQNSLNTQATQKTTTVDSNQNATKYNSTDDDSFYNKVKQNKGMLMRTLFVLMAVTSIVVIYFGVKYWRTRRRRNKSRKYGLITSSGADLEMEPLDREDDEDEDMTMFDRTK
ncbi:F174B-like protein [Mya arenaria]|uniref:F174B-like protein n=1 Tax=Mya arenaria TaxID=6604 RepID=A0ABY7DUB0_MYAAR|nr:F174B-like protein [Mya arenaria]